jgi:hypothetical protein
MGYTIFYGYVNNKKVIPSKHNLDLFRFPGIKTFEELLPGSQVYDDLLINPAGAGP